jgi:anti-anti-sigma factor
MATATQVHEAIDQLVETSAGEVVVDLGDVDFMDASIVRVFVAAEHELRTGGRSLVLRSPSRSARRVLELCGLDDSIRAVTTVTPGEALTSWMEVTVLPRVVHGAGQAIITEVVRGVPRAFEPMAS